MSYFSRLSTWKKVLAIFGLAVGLSVYLYHEHLRGQEDNRPALLDRVPEGDFMIRTELLDVAKETSALMFANKVKMRDFFSHEFLLGQGKRYGLDLIQPAYIFANSDGEWGAVVAVLDSSKVRQGFSDLKQNIEIADTTIDDEKCFVWKAERGYVGYGEDWMLIYRGNQFEKYFNQVRKAKKGDTLPKWREFLAQNQFQKQKLVLMANNKDLDDLGIEKAFFAHDSDSTTFTVLTYFKSKEPWKFKLKEKGKSLQYNAYTDRFLNFHMDVSEMAQDKNDPFYKILRKWSRKISFPLVEFFNAWTGHLSFVQGGYQVIKETYIETEFDENFNQQEVEKTREVKVPGFNLAVSLNRKGELFLEKLMERGILTKENEKYRFLFSPPLNYSVQNNYHLFYTAEYAPALLDDNLNNGLWNEKGTRFNFQLDSLNENEAFGEMIFPVERLIQRNKFF